MNARALFFLLKDFGVKPEQWGAGEAKRVEDLAKEIAEGESYLQLKCDGIFRVTEVVRMFIFHPTMRSKGCLLEWGQRLPDGRYRERAQLPAGKRKKNESLEQCAIRELWEELKLVEEEYTLCSDRSFEEKRSSKSYPGLDCLYVVQDFKVLLLPNAWALGQGQQFEVVEESGTSHVFRWEHE